METVTPRDPQGRVALMLCESILHVLVEEGVLSKAKAIEAIETVAELTREMADGNPAGEAHIAALFGVGWLIEPPRLRPRGSK